MKMKLIINYQLHNLFLQNDKFSLPNRNTLFSHLTQAKWFSKFDLKYEFWQWDISIKKNQPKTGFCIPNHHFHWKVMPFGLKTAPLLFQKAMIKIFQPILHLDLIYIDDILFLVPQWKSIFNSFTSSAKLWKTVESCSQKKWFWPKIRFLF